MNLDSLVKAYEVVSNFITRDPYYSVEIIAIGLGVLGLERYARYWHPRLEKAEEEEVGAYRKERLEAIMQKIAREPGLVDFEPSLIDPEEYRRVLRFLKGGSKRLLNCYNIGDEDMGHLKSMKRLYLTNLHNKHIKRLARKTFFVIAGKYLSVISKEPIQDTTLAKERTST